MAALTDWFGSWAAFLVAPISAPWVAQWIGLGGAALVLVAALIVPLAAFWARHRIGLVRRGQLLVYAVLAALVAFVPLPITGYPPLPLAAYLRSLTGDLSVTTLLLLSAIVLARLTGAPLALVGSPQRQTTLSRISWHDRLTLLLLIIAGALLLYPLALGAAWLDPYRWGYTAGGFLAALLAIALIAWFWRAWLTMSCISAAVLAWSLRTHESTNLWDYLIDPWLAIYALPTLLLAGSAVLWRRARVSFSARDAILIGAVALGWLSLGLYAREPWKADEGYSFGLVLSTVRDSQWLVPTLAGEPFLEKPPLVFWLATLCAKLVATLTGQHATADALIPMHVAGRGANVLIVIASFALLYFAARWCQRAQRGDRADNSYAAFNAAHSSTSTSISTSASTTAPLPSPWSAVLMLGATPAWLISSRYMTADLGFVLGAAMVLAGFAAVDAKLRWGGLLLGAGMTVGLLSKGLLLPGVVFIVIALLVLCAVRYRSWSTLLQLTWALLVFAILGAIWPWLLYQHSPALFQVWLWDNNLGRFLGDNALGPPSHRGESLLITLGYLLPLWPLALWSQWSLWRGRGSSGGAGAAAVLNSPLLPALLLSVVWVAVTLVSSTFRGIYLMPVLLPLALLAAAGLPNIWYSADVASSRGLRAIMIAVFAALALACVLLAGGVPLPLAPRGLPMPAGATTRLLWPLLLAALIFSFAAYKAYRGERFYLLPVVATALLVTLAVAIGLALPRADLGAGFSDVFKVLAAKIDRAAGCVASRKLGESERAMFDYYTAIRTVRFEIDSAAAASCPFVIEQVRPADRGLPECPGQVTRFSGSRFADEGDRFRLCGAAPAPEPTGTTTVAPTGATTGAATK